MIKNDGLLFDDCYSNDEGKIALSKINDLPRITKEDFDKMDISLLESQLKLENELLSSNVVYFCKTSITPRYKVKKYCDDNKINLNKTNRIQYADTFVINFDDIQIIKKLPFQKYWKIPLEYLENEIELSVKQAEALKLSKFKWIIIGEKYLNSPSYRGANAVAKIRNIIDSNDIKYEYMSFINDKIISALEISYIYLNNPNSYKIVFDQVISKKINEFELDLATFSHIDEMLGSKDSDNRVLAGEILSNCDRDKHKIPVLLLMNRYYSVLSNLRANNLSLKLLFEFFKSYSFNINPQEFINNLIAREEFKETDTQMLNYIILVMVKGHFINLPKISFKNVEIELNK